MACIPQWMILSANTGWNTLLRRSIEDMVAALECRTPEESVPIWELEFHAWDAASGRHVVLGREFEALSTSAREKALYTNAEIMLAVAEEMGWSALTVPGGYWDEAPGEPAYYCLPEKARFRQMGVLKKMAPDNLMLVASATGVLAADYYEEFCLRMFEDPESIDHQAEAMLRLSLELLRRFRDLGAGAVFTASDIAANSSHFATDLGKGASVKLGKGFRVLSLNDNMSWMTALGNDYSYEDIFVRQLENYGRKGDVALALSVSGNSPNGVKALEWAKENGLVTIALTGAKKGRMAEIAEHVVAVGDTHYGRVEDAHMGICHMLCYAFMENPSLAE